MVGMAWLVTITGWFLVGAMVVEPAETVHRQSRDTRLCLEQVYQVDLPDDFAPIGLTISSDIGPEPIITLWSRSALYLFSVSSLEPTLRRVTNAVPLNIDPLSAVVTEWDGESHQVQLFDASDGSIWTLDVATANVARFTRSAEASLASGATRDAGGWVRAHKIVDLAADTMGITLVRMDQQLPSGYVADSTLSTGGRRGVDRILHIRPGNHDGLVVSEAAFPFATVVFMHTGQELWRSYADPGRLRVLLEEQDLRYVVATPAIALGDGVLSTFVGLRSGLRVSAVRSPGGGESRYALIGSDMAFLAGISEHRLLVATRYDMPHELLLYRWSWIDESRSCA